jgi:hypothetical protein
MQLISPIIALHLSIFARANSNCSTKDFSNDLGIVDLKQNTQGSSLYCNAFALSVLFSQKLHQAISPADISIKLINSKYYSRGQGIPSYNILDFAKLIQWVCPENQNYKITSKEKDFYSVLHGDGQIIYSAASDKNLNHCEFGNFQFDLFKNSQPIFDLIFSSSFRMYSYDNALYLANEKNCNDKKLVNFNFIKKSVTSGWSNLKLQKEYASIIKELLNQDKALFSNLDSLIFFDAKSKYGLRTQFAHIFGNHATAIIGKREINGECFFKIRDSAISLKICNSNINKKIICENENTYEVPESLLMKSIKSILYIE